MKREFTQENFEEFLKRSAGSLRMKAPDKVWQNLSRELNKRRRRFIVGVSAFLLITSAIGYYITTNVPSPAEGALQKPAQQTAITENRLNKEKSSDNVHQSAVPQPVVIVQNNESTPVNVNRENTNTPSVFTNEIQTAHPNIQIGVQPRKNEISTPNTFTSTVVDSYTEFDEKETGNKKEVTQNNLTSVASLPMSIESVINSYKTKNKRKFETQLYFTPTISYRKLTENKSYLRTLDPANIPANLPALHSSVNEEVTHKPDVGFELGFTAKYPLSKKLKIRSGIQFNVNRYDAKAFSSPLSIATIALNNGPRADSLNTVSGYSNVHGYKSNWLQNFSLQVSAPIGVEYNFKGSDEMQFGIATTVQPTYILGDRSYLITTDYKSYTLVPWLIRRWNVNTALEAFVKYKAWQFGPQMRYQLLSSFESKYPVKENLFDFGLKVGVTLNNK